MPYAHPESLVSTAWLADHFDRPDVRVVDASFTLPGVSPTAQQEYARRHIPGAVFFDIDAISDHANPLPHMLPSAADFARMAGALGFGDERRIIVYDIAGFGSAPRAWWMLRAFGHRQVALLDGGLPKWLAEGRAVTSYVPKPKPVTFTARLDPSVVRDKAQLLANLAAPREQVLDARSAARFAGTAPEPRPGLRGGHIPGSISVPYDQLGDPKTRRFLPAEQIERRFRDAGVARDRPIVTSCGSGVTACALAFGLHLIGWPEAAVYDGSWSEWGLPGDTPVETGG
ncbi:MAG TPA: 3-mercaptopyruvate sulfurtransferase [Stellaceae bacterium]|jgi:thiosulfate/3-mercaptopyruvate sulfurtransferase|nr:3-mercaptopyruvate sulfurtransferase [Stellaceae bacterium]